MIPPSTFTSRPTYPSLQPAAGPGRHWLVLQMGNVSDSLRAELAQAFAPVQERLHIVWVGDCALAPEQAQAQVQAATLPAPVQAGPMAALVAPAEPRLLQATPTAALADLAALSKALAEQPVLVSDRLYVLGTEPFVWSVAEAAALAGWTPEQWQLCHTGSLQRKLWCTHCHGITEGVTTSIVACSGCGRKLLVRDHFSKRHGAFMGVMVDAEVPGQVPQAEETFL